MGHIAGLYRCILPCPHASELKEVSALCSGQPSVSVPGVTHGTIIKCPGVHEDNQSDKRICSAVRDSVAPVHRRLVNPLSLSSIGQDSDAVCQRASLSVGLPAECQEVRVGTCTGVYLPRDTVRSDRRESLGYRGEVEPTTECHSRVRGHSPGYSQAMAVAAGTDGLYGKGSRIRHAACQAFSGSLEQPVESADGQAGRQVSGACTVKEAPSMVEVPREPSTGSSLPTKSTTGSSFRGCKFVWLGGTSRQDKGTRQVVSHGGETAYQCTGTAGGTPGVGTLPGGTVRESGDGSLGQCDHSELHPQARGDALSDIVETSPGAVSMGGVRADSVEVSTYCRQAKCVGRQSFPAGADTANGVVPASASSQRSVERVGQAVDRPVRHGVQQEVGGVCVPVPRRASLCSRRDVTTVARDVRICVSPHSDSGISVAKDSARGVHSGSGGPMVAPAGMVPGDIGTVSGLACSVTQPVVSPKAATVGYVSSGSSDDEAPCLEIIQQAHRAKGFSAQAAERIAKRQKTSSTEVYEAKWRVFRRWCDSRSIRPRKASVCNVADFLCHLHEDRHLKVSTIEGYRTAINHVLKATGNVDIGKDTHISSLIANFSRDVSRRKSVAPPWNLAVVLQVLNGAPFEPMHLAPIKLVTFKTVFLLALATGSRRSELHALQQDTVQRRETTGDMLLYPNLEFVPKTQLGNQGSAVLQPIVVKALSRILSPRMEEDRVLCPVRALRFYLDRTKDMRGERKRLFIAFKKGYTKDICKSTVSSWLKKTIVLTHELASKDTCQLVGVKAHDVRAMASSWALQKSVSMDGILAACRWKNHSTFTQYYLKDLTVIREDMLQLGPIVAAQQLL